jgi:hypothetical protein
VVHGIRQQKALGLFCERQTGRRLFHLRCDGKSRQSHEVLALKGVDYGSSGRSIRDAADGRGSSFAILASYSAARSSSLFSVKGSACLARRRQRSACSFKVAKSITHQPGGVLEFLQSLCGAIVSVPFRTRVVVPPGSRMAPCSQILVPARCPV